MLGFTINLDGKVFTDPYRIQDGHMFKKNIQVIKYTHGANHQPYPY